MWHFFGFIPVLARLNPQNHGQRHEFQKGGKERTRENSQREKRRKKRKKEGRIPITYPHLSPTFANPCRFGKGKEKLPFSWDEQKKYQVIDT